MATDPRAEPEKPVGKTDEALALELIIEPGEPMSGSVGLAGQSASRPFQGWIDLMSALNGLRHSDLEDRP
jgi:hypothetical protein